jgi:flagellar biogenesis protein FliO
MWQQILAVFLVLALLMGTLILLRRKGIAQFSGGFRKIPGKAREMRILERIAVGPQHSLLLVHVRNSVFLIGLSPSGCDKIDVFASDAPLPDLPREL